VAAGKGTDPLATLLQAALALPVLALPMRTVAAESGEAGFAVLTYRERGLMRVTEPMGWVRMQLEGGWEIRAGAVLDVVTGASPRFVTNESGAPVQSVTGASIDDRRRGADVRIGKRIGDFNLAVSRTRSDEDDYRSRAFGAELQWELDDRLTTVTAGYGKANDRVRSTENPQLDEPRVTREYLAGVARVLSPVAVIQASVLASRGKGFYDDPYKFTLTFYPDGSLPALAADRRPDRRESLAFLVRYRHHFPAASASLQADYRFYRDDWGIRSHALEVGWSHDLGPDWTLRPALRYATQGAADFYSPTVPRPQPDIQSSDQRLAAFGSLSPSLRIERRFDSGLSVEATAGLYRNAASYRAGGGGSPAFETLRAWYIVAGFTQPF
jgi:hypothetical protein